MIAPSVITYSIYVLKDENKCMLSPGKKQKTILFFSICHKLILLLFSCFVNRFLLAPLKNIERTKNSANGMSRTIRGHLKSECF